MTSDSTRNRLLAIVAVLAAGAALKLTQPITLPLAAAIFLILLAWPLQTRLERAMPRWVAYLGTILGVLAGLAAFLAMIAWSLGVVAERSPEIIERIVRLGSDLAARAGARGLPADADWNGLGAETIFPVVASVWRAAAMLLLTIAFFVLGLTEMRRFRLRLIGHYGDSADSVLDAIAEASGRVRGFVMAITFAGLLGGVLTLVYGTALGLEYALVWAFLAYLLNYIPVVGSTISVFPPALWALVQFDGVARPAAVLLGLGAIQFVVGNYVAPRFEARYTTISAFVILISILVWWWIWGGVGALLGVPLTVAILTACSYFDGTRWITALLSDAEAKG